MRASPHTAHNVTDMIFHSVCQAILLLSRGVGRQLRENTHSHAHNLPPRFLMLSLVLTALAASENVTYYFGSR